LVVTVYEGDLSVFTKVVVPGEVSWSPESREVVLALPVKKGSKYVIVVSTLAGKGGYRLLGRDPAALIEIY
jgi:hypothetical protein